MHIFRPILQKYSPNAASVKEINQELERYKDEFKKSNNLLNCYHAKATREDAEKLLKDHYNLNRIDGCFLIRSCSASPDDFSLSLISDGAFHHYRISWMCDTYYHFNDNPPIQGLDELIRKYQEKSHGMPCPLAKVFIPGEPIPPKARISGKTNLLHQTAANITQSNKLKTILSSPFCPDIDERNEEGQTALDIACTCENVDAVKELIKKKPLTNLKAKDGCTALHRAAEDNSPNVIQCLLSYTDVNPTERTSDNYVPLHLAAKNNSFMCVKVLLKFGVPDMPRTSDNKTPLDIAIENNAVDTIEILKKHVPKKPKTKMQDWLFDSSVTREIAQKILIDAKKEFGSGVFLVRRRANETQYVLSVLTNEFYNYEICMKENDNFYYIDDGPYFRSLEHLIEHHFKYEDGLPTKLSHPVSPNSLCAQNVLNNLRSFQPLHKTLTTVTTKSADTLMQPNATVKAKASHFNRNTALQDAIAKLKVQTRENKNKFQEINKQDILLESVIGEGEFGTVYKGKLKGTREVAIKMLKDCTANKEFLREAEIMSTLGNHPCIIKLFGIVRDKDTVMMVQELMLCSLLEKLYTNAKDIQDTQLKNWAIQIVSGMRHMELKKIVHRDLAARNILLGSDLQAKISDFGLSRDTEGKDVYTQQSDSKIPIKWYAPESIEKCIFTSKSDVWSFGITLWEMWSYGDVPYGEKGGAEVYQLIKSGKRLERPSKCPIKTYEVMRKCWTWEEHERPSFDTVSSYFSNDSEYEVTKSIYFDNGQF